MSASNGTVSISEKDDTHFWDFVIFEAEGTLFKLPKYGFVQNSKAFETTYTLPHGEDGTTEANPFKLEGIKKLDFKRFLLVLYPINSKKLTTKEEWCSVLKLAKLWDFSDIINIAKDALTPLLTDPIERVKLAREFEILPWLLSAYVELAKRSNTLSRAEAEVLGFETAYGLMSVREEATKWEAAQTKLILGGSPFVPNSVDNSATAKTKPILGGSPFVPSSVDNSATAQTKSILGGSPFVLSSANNGATSQTKPSKGFGGAPLAPSSIDNSATGQAKPSKGFGGAPLAPSSVDNGAIAQTKNSGFGAPLFGLSSLDKSATAQTKNSGFAGSLFALSNSVDSSPIPVKTHWPFDYMPPISRIFKAEINSFNKLLSAVQTFNFNFDPPVTSPKSGSA